MDARQVGTNMRYSKRTWNAGTWGVAAVCIVGILALAACYQNSPTAPEGPAPTSSTTTTTTTTTTSSTLPGATTTTTTSTTSGLVDYANQVHPIWASEGCSASGCHSGGPAPNLGGTPVDSCNGLATQDAVNANLVITGGGETGAEIITKPQPGTVSHVGGDFPCFGGAGSACYDVVLLWLQQGANGPGGSTCGG